jgi:hypothetical protein
MRNLLMASIMSLAIAVPMQAGAETSIEVRLRAGTAPPPPQVVYRETPGTRIVPNTSVYVVIGDRHDYDYFRYGVYWYIYRGDHWYRARRYTGPFTVVEAKYVPRAIINVPPRYWRHHPHGGPPGQMKKAVHAERTRGDRAPARGKVKDKRGR